MPNTPFPAAPIGLPTVVPFPIDRVRPGAMLLPPTTVSTGVLDRSAWNRCLTTALVLDQFADRDAADLESTVAEMVFETPEVLASIVRRNGEDIRFLRSALAHFTALDDLIGSAAARVFGKDGA